MLVMPAVDRPLTDDEPESVGVGQLDSQARSAPWRQRGRPKTFSATMLRWISDVPPAMVPAKARR